MIIIPGLIGITPALYDSDGTLFESMIKAIRHRDFHQADRFRDSFFAVARIHIGIFNPEPQPIFNEDPSLCIFMDGKIYDHEKELDKLKVKGHLSIGTDPEFCLRLYEELGKDFVKELNGCFVLAICDLKNRKLLIANDRYGLRPIYFSYNNNRLLFSSEVKAILEDKNLNEKLNDKAVADFFAFGQLLGDKTFFEGIKALPPASILFYEHGKTSMEQYWDLDYDETYVLSEKELVDELVRTYKKAVSKRMCVDNRYGVSLSGGLDSRSVVGAINGNRRHLMTAYTYGPTGNDESRISKLVAKKAGIDHKFVALNYDVLLSYAKNVVYLTDGMGLVSWAYLPYVYERIKRLVNVVFVGGPMGSYVLGGDFLDDPTLRAKNDGELLEILYKKMIQRGVEREEVLAKLFKKEYYNKIKDMPLNSLKEAYRKTTAKHPGNRTDQFIIQNLVNRYNILGHVVRRNYVEDTLPIYDNDYFDTILKIPPELRMHHRIYIEFLKKLSPKLVRILYQRTMIPASAPLILWKTAWTIQVIKEIIKKLIWRFSHGTIFLPNKHSYIDPNELFRVNKEWRNFVKRILLGKKSLSRKYLNKEYIEVMIREHESGKADHSQRIILLATFELFLRLFDHRFRASNARAS